MFWIFVLIAWAGLMLLLHQVSTTSKSGRDREKVEKVLNPVASGKPRSTIPFPDRLNAAVEPKASPAEKRHHQSAHVDRPAPLADTKNLENTDRRVENTTDDKGPDGYAKRQIRGRVSIIIDDMGRDIKKAEKFLALPYPLAFAVLPYEAHSREVAEMVKKSGRTLLLHMPMEPKGYPGVNPGPGALLLSQSEQERYRLFKKALEMVPGAVGVNNHMGSRFTENRRAMKLFMKWLKEEGLFFVDSRTTAGTVACEVAREVGVICLERNVFIDHELSRKFIVSQLDELARRASLQGYAIAIGHPHEITYRILQQSLSKYAKGGLQLVSPGNFREQ